MAIFDLSPPPEADDDRFDQWLYQFWAYVRGVAQSNSSSTIIEERVFRQRDNAAGTAPGMDVAEKQLIEATQVYARHPNPYNANDVAEKQQILANQIFGG